MLVIQLAVFVVMILLAVGYISLLERKILSFMQNRRGPNKVGFMGLLQPISDAMKLIFKSNHHPNKTVMSLYFLSPLFFFIISLFIWATIPLKGTLFFFNSSALFVLVCLSFSVYGMIMMGWISNSKYSLIGAIRSIAQSISYEIVLSFGIFSVMMISSSTSLLMINKSQELFWLIFPLLFLFLMMMIVFIAEMNRTPFDLSESESELVSGYCIEYGSISYTLIFMSEVSSMLYFSFLACSVFTDISYIFMKGMLFLFLFMWFRATFPRTRFDKLMALCWVIIMPLIISMILLYFVLV